jgi:hypothetical protein
VSKAKVKDNKYIVGNYITDVSKKVYTEEDKV